ncbi:hypothetical protein H3H36_14475 [Duganella sp. FT3S]|uniref:Lauroyl/myristoyl acyltransferase n=1 Tax=Rugamonas fusca TaxID=2758568 RepID=A0A7W2I7L2_9BURK|nr:hypothetical protein [Rugamonas fusca]MBA5606559.1 hypothetical protein [Rugamonas fusca]
MTIRLADYLLARDTAVASQVASKYTDVAGDPHMRTRLERLTALMLEYFLPELRGADLGPIVDNVFRNQECAAYEASVELGEDYPDLLDQLIQVEPAGRLASSLGKRALYCAFHLDSYRLLIAYLRIQCERPVGLLVTPDVIAAQRDQINAIGASALPGAPERTDVRLFDAESFEGLGDALRFLGKGGLLVIYIDGNSGFGGMAARHKSMARIPFLGGQIMARLGVAQLASRLAMPIVPLYVENLDNGCRRLHCLPELAPPAQGSRAAQIETTRQLYAILEQRIRRQPASWEGWLYVNRFVEQLPPAAGQGGADGAHTGPSIAPQQRAPWAAGEPLVFAHRAYTLLPYPGATVLMCKRRLSYQLVSKAAVAVLERAFHGPVDAAALAAPQAIAELVRLGALVPRSSAMAT